MEKGGKGNKKLLKLETKKMDFSFDSTSLFSVSP